MPDMPDCVVSNFLTTNSLMIVGLLIGGITGCGMCIIKSRCSRIKCCCCLLERDVLSEETINNMPYNNILNPTDNTIRTFEISNQNDGNISQSEV
tara:strand:- start:24299 stop:24583 length:285 start_codon:yes stop_codon:yes gene_type:complete